MTVTSLSTARFVELCRTLVAQRPLVHCLTNEVVQAITANVLLASGASPAMVVANDEAGDFASIASSVLINLGTPYPERLQAMRSAIDACQKKGTPWVLDPVAAGVLPWRDRIIKELAALKPTVIRANASEVLAMAGMGHGGHGVDSTDSSRAALVAAQHLATQTQSIVAVTGEEDYVTDGNRTIAIAGGHALATLVVGTGCSLSALVAAFLSIDNNALEATAAAMTLAKRAQEKAISQTQSPGSFRTAYIDALFELTHGAAQ
ncbi:MAG: hydroxyethylthiazole kinase [Burkholderiaceae bacterium]|nr:hydroxyethylthiazole kinase [Burkholderiaceae bacterium]